jgi:hypothetical protein
VTGGDAASLATGLQDSVGDGALFTSAALLPVGGGEPIATIGEWADTRVAGRDDPATIVARALAAPFAIIDLLDANKSAYGADTEAGQVRRLGYAVADSADDPQYVVYAERVLSADPYTRRRTDQPFAQLDYAMYLGSPASPDTLLGASERELPLRGRTSSAIVPFGDQQLLLVTAPIGQLSGDLFADLWWIVAAIGALVSIGFATLTRRLLERRDTAVDLAAENERLYEAQRRIADTLQLSLLPQQLSTPADVDAAVRYWPAGSANLIGG